MKRPALRWHGGKFRLAKWIISHMPEHRIYVEPFAGAASVLLQKPRSYAEVLNDVNDDLVNYFSVLRDRPQELISVIEKTPFARREFEIASIMHPDPVEKARRLCIRSFMGFGSDSACNPERATGFRSNSHRSGTTPAIDWKNFPKALEEIAERLRGVIIENRDWLAVCEGHDSEKTVFYFDPPYLESTRLRYGCYGHELTDADHVRIIDFAKRAKGRTLISGYESELYRDLLRDWIRVERDAMADGALKRREILWIRP